MTTRRGPLCGRDTARRRAAQDPVPAVRRRPDDNSRSALNTAAVARLAHARYRSREHRMHDMNEATPAPAQDDLISPEPEQGQA